jgi:hypothetical protein
MPWKEQKYTLAVYDPTAATYVYKSTVSLTACNLVSCSYTPATALNVETPYQWMVHANNDAGYGAYSAPVDFIIKVPAVPTPAAPESIIDDSTPTFSWAPVDHATSYTVLLYNATANTNVFTNTVDSSVCGTSACNYNSPVTLAKNVNYTWQVSAKDDAGSSAFSSSVSFKISAPGAPYFLSPSGTIYTQLPTFSWRKPDGAVSYRLEIWDNTGSPVRGDLPITPSCNDTTCTWSGAWIPRVTR